MSYRSVLWNLAGTGVPLLAGIIAIPQLVRVVGVERFSVITLAWVLVGYFSLFDFGLGRAVTCMVAQRLCTGARDDIRRLVPTALTVMNGLSVVGALLLGALSSPLVNGWLSMPLNMRDEALVAFFLMAATIPFVISAAGFRGLLEGFERFDWVNWVRLPLGVSNYLAPLAVVSFSKSLVPVISVLAATRVLSWFAYYCLCRRLVPGIPLLRPEIHRQWLTPLFSFGGWLTVSNVVGPVMTYMDRFLIGGMVSMADVAYYATPYEMVSRLLIIAGAVTAVLLPTIAGALMVDRQQASLMYQRALRDVFFATLLPVALVSLFAKEGLGLWLNEDFALRSSFVLQCLAMAILVNSVAQVSFVVLHAAGRADWTAKLHLLELPIYLLALVWLARNHGIHGVAAAWFARATLDAAAMYILSLRVVSLPVSVGIMQITIFLLFSVLVAAATQIASPPVRALLFVVVLLVCLVRFWRHPGAKLSGLFRA